MCVLSCYHCNLTLILSFKNWFDSWVFFSTKGRTVSVLWRLWSQQIVTRTFCIGALYWDLKCFIRHVIIWLWAKYIQVYIWFMVVIYTIHWYIVFIIYNRLILKANFWKKKTFPFYIQRWILNLMTNISSLYWKQRKGEQLDIWLFTVCLTVCNKRIYQNFKLVVHIHFLYRVIWNENNDNVTFIESVVSVCQSGLPPQILHLKSTFDIRRWFCSWTIQFKDHWN